MATHKARASEGLVLYVEGALREHSLEDVLVDVAHVVAEYVHRQAEQSIILGALDQGEVEAEARHALHAALAIVDTVAGSAGLSR